MDIESEVLIVGAGIAGVALALAMGRKGRQVVLIERSKQFPNIPKGDFLQPVTIDLLDKLGVLPEVTKHCAHVARVNYGTLGGVNCFTGSYEEMDMPVRYALNGDHHHIHQSLFNAIEEMPNVRFYPGMNAGKLLFTDHYVSGIEADSAGKTVRIGSKILVGSDGIKSKIRDQLGLKYHLYPYEEKMAKMFAFTFHDVTQTREEASFFFGEGVSCGVFPLPGQRLRIYLALRKDIWQLIREDGIESLRGMLLSLCPHLQQVISQIVDFKQVQSIPAYYLHTEKWAINGAVLLGDACHALSPALGQGMNLAIQGAVELSNTLEEALINDDCSESQLRLYEKKRRKYVRLIQRNSTAHTYCWFVKNRAFVTLRNAAFRRIGKCPNLLKEQMLTTSGYSDKPPSFSHMLRFAGLMKP